MRESKAIYSLLIATILMVVMAGCGILENEILLEPTSNNLYLSRNEYNLTVDKISLEPTPTNFNSTHNEYNSAVNGTLLEPILNDFYTSHDERGLAAVEELLITDPANALALALRGAFELRQEEWDAGFEDANKALEIDPDLAFAYVDRAWFLQYHGADMEAARIDIDTALALEPNLAFAHCIKAGLHPTNDIQPVLQSYEKAIELRPDYYVAYINLAFITVLSVDAEMGFSYFEKAIEINPDNARAYYERGDIYRLQRNYESAIPEYTQAIKLGANTASIYEGLVESYTETGNYANAITNIEHVIDLDPTNINAYNLAALLIAYTDSDLEKALAYNNLTLGFSPQYERYRDTKAYIYYKMGKYDEAFQIFTDLIENGYDNSYYGRGLIYYSLGDKENAISDFQAYLAEQNGDFRSREVEKLLNEMSSESGEETNSQN